MLFEIEVSYCSRWVYTIQCIPCNNCFSWCKVVRFFSLSLIPLIAPNRPIHVSLYRFFLFSVRFFSVFNFLHETNKTRSFNAIMYITYDNSCYFIIQNNYCYYFQKANNMNNNKSSEETFFFWFVMWMNQEQ